jgi:hypothetical protein
VVPILFLRFGLSAEVDLVAAKQMIHDTVERPDLTHSEKAAVLGGNAKRFFRV